MDNILFLSNANRFQLTPFFDGMNAVAVRNRWNIQVLGGIYNRGKVRSLLEFWKPAGCIVQCATYNSMFNDDDFGDIPLVYIDRDPASLRPKDLAVLHDTEETGHIAAKELLSLKLPHYAYARITEHVFWCRNRLKAFKADIELNGAECIVSGNTLIGHISDRDRLKDWIRNLPKPVGLFASNDGVGESVILAANELGISIPDELAIVSVDNCETICENTNPTLTSIAPDFVAAGRLAAELLRRKIADRSLQGVVLRYGQSEIVRRQSSRIFRRNDARVNAILERIRKDAAKPDFSFEDTAAAAGCSFRCAEIRFREATGQTMRAALQERRVSIAKRLLRETDSHITEIASLSGFKSFATFSRVFAALVGMSPRDYRKGQSL